MLWALRTCIYIPIYIFRCFIFHFVTVPNINCWCHYWMKQTNCTKPYVWTQCAPSITCSAPAFYCIDGACYLLFRKKTFILTTEYICTKNLELIYPKPVNLYYWSWDTSTLQWRHNERDGGSNHQPHECLLNRLFRHRSKKISTLRLTGHCEGNSPETGEFPAQRASNTENASIWWRHH